MTGNRLTGTVKSFDASKGYGYIDSAGMPQPVFVHYSSIIDDRYRTLRVGDHVTFDFQDAPGGPQAVEVSKL